MVHVRTCRSCYAKRRNPAGNSVVHASRVAVLAPAAKEMPQSILI